MDDTESNREKLIQELGKLRAIDAWFSQEAAAGHVRVMLKRYPDIATARAVIDGVLETWKKVPTPAEFIELRDRYLATRRERGGYCPTCDDTGYRVESHVRHTPAGPYRFDMAFRCQCGGFTDDRPVCRACNDQGWYRRNGVPTACHCGHGASFDADYQVRPLKERLRADGMDEDLIACLDIPKSKKSEMRDLILGINSQAYVRSYRGSEQGEARSAIAS